MDIHDSEYQKKMVSPEKAVELIPSKGSIVVGVTIVEPPAILDAIAERARSGGFEKLLVYTFNPQKYLTDSLLKPDLVDCVRTRAWFVSGAIRGLVKVGLIQFVPSYFHEIPKLIRGMNVDVLATTVSPMDKSGYFSCCAASYVIDAARRARNVIVEVNRNLPRVFGDTLIHISDVKAIVENNVPLLESKVPEKKPEDEIIGKALADIIPDGAVLQLGIGGLPNAICPYLTHHKDLGIHSELIGPGMIELIKKGVITGRRKQRHPYKHVFGIPYGTKEDFDFINDNISMESYSADYLMDPCVIGQNDNMISVNSIIEVDLTGQCNAESIGGSQFSGTGGQVDFVRGAYRSRGGKSILAFYSTAKGGKVSRIVPQLKFTSVTTPRVDVQYLATEYGIVNIKGKSTEERAIAITSLAHPDFRDNLMRKAEEMGLL
jgi:itaconate CoA-transferase